MMFLADAAWIGTVSAAASVLAVIISIIIAYRSRKKKCFSYEIISENLLISMDDDLKGKLKLHYEDNPVENVHLLLIRFANSGNIPITAGDYERPVTLRFEDGTTILSAEYMKANPDSLKVELKVEDNVVAITPILMNGGDSFMAKILLGKHSGFDVDARIVGVNSLRVIRRQPPTDSSFRDVFTPVGIALVVSTSVIISAVIIGSISLVAASKQKQELEEYSKVRAERDKLRHDVDNLSYQLDQFQKLALSMPVIKEIRMANPSQPLTVGKPVKVEALTEGEIKQFDWTVTDGRITGEGSFATFTLGNAAGVDVMLTVTDKYGKTDRHTVRLCRDCIPPLREVISQENQQ